MTNYGSSAINMKIGLSGRVRAPFRLGSSSQRASLGLSRDRMMLTIPIGCDSHLVEEDPIGNGARTQPDNPFLTLIELLP